MIEANRLLERFHAIAKSSLEINETKRRFPGGSTKLAPPTQFVRVSLYQSSGSL